MNAPLTGRDSRDREVVGRFVAAAGGPIHYRCAGSGPAVVMLHDSPRSSRLHVETMHWHMLRDSEGQWPWFSSHATARRDLSPLLDADKLHPALVGILKQPVRYGDVEPIIGATADVLPIDRPATIEAAAARLRETLDSLPTIGCMEASI